MKFLTFVLGLFLSFQSYATNNSLKFGGPGATTSAKTHVFIDQDEAAPKCLCTRFSFLVDDDNGAIGSTIVERVVVWGVDKSSYTDLDSHALRLDDIKTSSGTPALGTPRKSPQVVYMNGLTSSKDMFFSFVALKRKCMNPTVAECMKYEIVTQGTFTAEDVLNLNPATAESL